MHLKETVDEGIDWIYVAGNKGKQRAVLNAEMNFKVPLMPVITGLSESGTFLRKILLHGFRWFVSWLVS